MTICKFAAVTKIYAIYSIDNNIAERFMKPLVNERKNSYFYESDRMANVSAVYHTLISTCRLMKVSVCEYFSKVLVSIIKDFFTIQDAGHLWFLPVLLSVMFIAFVMDKIVKKKQSLLFAIIIISGLLYAFAFIVRTPIIRLTLLYYPFFLLGEIIHIYATLKKQHFHWNVVIGCLLFFVLAITVLPIENHFISLLAKASLVYIIFCSIPAKQNKVMQYFDKNSFGIYLLHSPLLLFGLTHFSNYPPLIFTFLQLMVAISISLLTICAIRRVNLHKIIGE